MSSSYRLWLISAVSLVSSFLVALPSSSHITAADQQADQQLDHSLQDQHSKNHSEQRNAGSEPDSKREAEIVSPVATPIAIPESVQSGSSQAGAIQINSIQLETQPPLSQVVPAHDLVKLQLKALDANQRPLRNAQWQLTLLAPPQTPWFSSDFPIVEGTTLLDTQAIPTGDAVELSTVLPIRGNYQLQVTVQSETIAKPLTQTFVLHVPENPIKYRNTAILAAILLAVGFGGGWIIAAQPQTRSTEIAPQSVRLLLSGATIAAIVSLLVVNISAEQTTHHEAHSAAESSESIVEQADRSGNWKLEYVGDSEASVGSPAKLAARVIDTTTNQPVRNAVFQIEAIALEHGEPVLSYQGKPDQQGLLTWEQQFFDGAPHDIQIQATVNPNLSPLTLSQTLDVEGISPPLLVRFITLGYMTAIVALGMALGFGFHRWNPPLFRSLLEASSRN